MQPLIPYEPDVSTKLAKDGKLTFAGAGTFGCVYQGRYDGVIRFLKAYRDRRGVQDGIRECVVGELLKPQRLPGAHAFWVQIAACASDNAAHMGSLLTREPPKKTSEHDCWKNMRVGGMERFVTALERAGSQLLTDVDGLNDSSRIQSIMFQLAWALTVANNTYGLVHGDLKPENIMFDNTKAQDLVFQVERQRGLADVFGITSTVSVRIIDLGSVSASAARPVEEMYQPRALLGNPTNYSTVHTPIYSAVDVSRDDRRTAYIPEAGDMFALGLIMCAMALDGAALDGSADNEYRMAMRRGHPPFHGRKEYFRDALMREDVVPMIKRTFGKRFEFFQDLVKVLRLMLDIGVPIDPTKDFDSDIQAAAYRAAFNMRSYATERIQAAIIARVGNQGLVLIRRLLDPLPERRLRLGHDAAHVSVLGMSNVLFHRYFASMIVGTKVPAGPYQQINVLPSYNASYARRDVLSDIDGLYRAYQERVASAGRKSGPALAYSTADVVLKSLRPLLSNLKSQDLTQFIDMDVAQQPVRVISQMAAALDNDADTRKTLVKLWKDAPFWQPRSYTLRRVISDRDSPQKMYVSADQTNSSYLEGGYRVRFSNDGRTIAPVGYYYALFQMFLSAAVIHDSTSINVAKKQWKRVSDAYDAQDADFAAIIADAVTQIVPGDGDSVSLTQLTHERLGALEHALNASDADDHLELIGHELGALERSVAALEREKNNRGNL